MKRKEIFDDELTENLKQMKFALAIDGKKQN